MRARSLLATLLALSACESPAPPILVVPADPVWQWENPHPIGAQLQSVRAAPDGTLFAVGFDGAFLRRHSTGWEVLPTPFVDALLDLWVFAADHVMVVGEAGRLSEWRSGVWEHHTLTQRHLGGIWSDGDFIVVVGDAGTRLLRTAGEWSEVDDAHGVDFEKVWGASPEQLWVVAFQGRIVHYDGTNWVTEFQTVEGPILGVWGRGPESVYAVGDRNLTPTVWERDNGSWSVAHSAPGADRFAAVTGGTDGSVWALAFGGALSHFNGTQWLETIVVNRDGLHDFTNLAWLDGDLWVTASSGGIYWGQGTASWLRDTDVLTPTARYRAVWSHQGSLWAVGNGPVISNDGTGWQQSHFVDHHLYAGRGTWAVGEGGGVVNWDSGTCVVEHSFESLEDNLRAALEFSDGSRLAVGERGIMLRDDGEGWEIEDAGSAQGTSWFAAWAASDQDYWIVGDEGRMRRYQGVSYQDIDPITIADLQAVWGSGPSDVYAAGSLGAVVHFDGDAWRHVAPVTDENDWFTAIAGRGPDDVYALTAEGLIYHFDGDLWSRRDDIKAVSALGSVVHEDDVWVVGDNATVFRHGSP